MRSPLKTGKRSARWWLYVLRCADGTLYTGITTDLRRRLLQHNSGTASRYTRGRLPAALVHQERCRDKSSALKKEFRIKALPRREKEDYIRKKAGSASAAA